VFRDAAAAKCPALNRPFPAAVLLSAPGWKRRALRPDLKLFEEVFLCPHRSWISWPMPRLVDDLRTQVVDEGGHYRVDMARPTKPLTNNMLHMRRAPLAGRFLRRATVCLARSQQKICVPFRLRETVETGIARAFAALDALLLFPPQAAARSARGERYRKFSVGYYVRKEVSLRKNMDNIALAQFKNSVHVLLV